MPLPLFTDFKVRNGALYAKNFYLYEVPIKTGKLRNIYRFFRNEEIDPRFTNFVSFDFDGSGNIVVGTINDEHPWVGAFPPD